jgi:uncharacterized protein with von Willebrand factor type A (vWA) domain
LQTPEYHALHAATRLDEAASAIAAVAFAEQFTRLQKELGEGDRAAGDDEEDGAAEDSAGEKAEAGKGPGAVKEEAPSKKADDARDGPAGKADDGKEEGATRGPGVGTEAEAARKASAAKEAPVRAKPAAPAGGLGRDMATLRAVGRALLRAGAEVGELHEAAAAVGMGPGLPGGNDPRQIAALFRRVRDNPTLRRVCELAGRYRLLAQSRQRRKVAHGMDDLVGVTLGGDVGKLLPAELARLAIPDCADDVLRRLMERQAQCREHRAVEPVAKGPIVVVADESGSMEGEKGHTAKALALALAWIARQQRRWCGLCASSGDTGERLLALPPHRWDEAALLDWLEQFLGGGSHIDVPVRELPGYWRRLGAPEGDTDVLFLTDAICRIPPDVQKRFLDWKRLARARLITLVVEGEPGDLTAISDEVYRVPSLDVTEEAVGRVLSL